MGDKVDSGVGLSYRPANLQVAWLAGPTTLYAGVNFIASVKNYEFGYSVRTFCTWTEGKIILCHFNPKKWLQQLVYTYKFSFLAILKLNFLEAPPILFEKYILFLLNEKSLPIAYVYPPIFANLPNKKCMYRCIITQR